MKRTMILPAAIALGVHVLLLGFRVPEPEQKVPEKVAPPDQIKIEIPPDEPEIVVSGQNAGQPERRATPPPQGAEIPKVGPVDVDVPVIERPLMPPIKGVPTDLIPSNYQPGSGNNGPFANLLRDVDLDNRPLVRYQPAPTPPRGLHADRVSVVVEFIVARDGTVIDASIVETSDRAFDEACLRAVRRWRFEPGKKNGVAVSFRVAQPFVFSFRE